MVHPSFSTAVAGTSGKLEEAPDIHWLGISIDYRLDMSYHFSGECFVTKSLIGEIGELLFGINPEK